MLIKEKPDWVLVFGDTNSTLAAALAACKIHIPICHVEAGARVHNMNNPEEINRICTDHVSTLLLASTQSGYDEMAKEGLQSKGYIVGDPMYDAFIEYGNVLDKTSFIMNSLEGERCLLPDEFYYITCHREENTNDSVLFEVFKALQMLEIPTIYPVHPRNKDRAIRIKQQLNSKKIILVEPVGYLESIFLVKNAKKIITDSGGLQREAFFAEKKCVTLLNFVCWPETMVNGRNELCRPIADEIISKLAHEQEIISQYQPFGDGHAAKKIVKLMEEYKF